MIAFLSLVQYHSSKTPTSTRTSTTALDLPQPKMTKSFFLNASVFAATTLAVPVKCNTTLVFDDCPTSLVGKNSRMQCGSIQVPMDWSNPSSGKITIGVVKIPAKDPSNRIGPLFYNPGGPGSLTSAQLALVVSGEQPIHNDILDRFDIIGVDIRGTGLSSPISCSRELFNAPPTFYATTPESFDALATHNQAFRQSCLNMTGSNLIDYMDTVSTVHDHEAVRQALGGERLTWLGQSYGTLLASQYAELYAENIRGMVLDGVVSNSQAPTAEFVPDATSTEATMNRFFDWCSKSNLTSCRALSHNASKTITELWVDLLARAAKSPLPAPECASGKLPCPGDAATLNWLLEGATQLLFPGEEYYPVLAMAVEAAILKNDPSYLLTHAFSVPKGTPVYEASQAYALVAITCQDFYNPEVSATQMSWWHQIAAHQMPHTLGVTPTLYFNYPCVGWPEATRNPRHRISIPDKLSSKALLVSNLWDPSTPTAWALQVQEEIGLDRAVLIGRKKPGHLVYFWPDAYEGPTVAAMNRYLLTLEAPEQRTVFDN